MGLGHGLGHQELGLMTSSMSLGGLGGVLVWGHVDLATRDCVHHGGLGDSAVGLQGVQPEFEDKRKIRLAGTGKLHTQNLKTC